MAPGFEKCTVIISILQMSKWHLETLSPRVNLCSVALVASNSLWRHGLQPARLLCPWNSLGKNTREGCHVLLQGGLPNPGSNLYFLHWQADSLPLSHQGSPKGRINHDEIKHHPDLSDMKAYFSYHHFINTQSPIILPSTKRHLEGALKGSWKLKMGMKAEERKKFAQRDGVLS